MTRWVALLAAGLLGGCYEGGDVAAGGEDSATDGDESGGGPQDDDGGGSEGGDPQARCDESKIGPPMLRRLTRVEFEQTVLAIFPEVEDAFEGVSLGADTVSELGFANDAEVLVVSEQVAREILQTAEEVATLVTAPQTLPTVLPCSSGAADAACAASFIADVGEQMFRRPLSAEEEAEYLALFSSVQSQADFASGLKWTIVALLESPHLVYRSELGVPDGDGARTLVGWELATALAYDFSGRPPGEELRALGAGAELDDPQARVEEARRLLATAAGRETMSRFFEDWLDYRKVVTESRHDAPDFELVREAMAEETRRFIESVVFDAEGDVGALLLADYTELDAALSSYYGYGDVAGEYTMVPRPEAWGVGLLAQGSVLASNAHVGASSPTRRGLLVYERLLCQVRPPVPDDVPPLEEPSPGSTATTRERYEEQHMANAGCRSCHQLFDPVGFAFEHFDAAGRYRADEAGVEIDASGQLPPGVTEERDSFVGLTELSQVLAAQPEVTDCVSGLAAHYVFGGAGGTPCLAEDARTQLAEGGYGLAEYVAQLAAAPHFANRE